MKLTASETNIKSLTDELFDHFKTDAESRGWNSPSIMIYPIAWIAFSQIASN